MVVSMEPAIIVPAHANVNRVGEICFVIASVLRGFTDLIVSTAATVQTGLSAVQPLENVAVKQVSYRLLME